MPYLRLFIEDLTSRAKAVTIVRHGGVEVLEVREVEAPASPTADRVRVRVRAAALNRADILQRLGYYPSPAGFPKDIPGLEFAGEIEAVGDEVSLWTPGQRVFGIIGGGAQAEFVVVPENHLAAIPSNLDWASAAGRKLSHRPFLFTQAGWTETCWCTPQVQELVRLQPTGSGSGATFGIAHG